MLLRGPAGCGKTRLLNVVAEWGAEAGMPVYRGAAWDSSDAPPLWPWREVVRDAIAGRHGDRGAGAGRVPVPGRYEARPFVIGIDDPDRVAEHEPAVAEPRPRRDHGAPVRVADPQREAG